MHLYNKSGSLESIASGQLTAKRNKSGSLESIASGQLTAKRNKSFKWVKEKLWPSRSENRILWVRFTFIANRCKQWLDLSYRTAFKTDRSLLRNKSTTLVFINNMPSLSIYKHLSNTFNLCFRCKFVPGGGYIFDAGKGNSLTTFSLPGWRYVVCTLLVLPLSYHVEARPRWQYKLLLPSNSYDFAFRTRSLSS